MSRWWPRRIRVCLTPYEVSLADTKGIDRHALDSGEDFVDWRPAVALLAEQLAKEVARGAVAIDLELSNHFVRYLVVPRRKDLRGRAEVEAFARHRFTQTYGAAAQEWDLCISEDGAARMAAAVDRRLLAELRRVCKDAKAQLKSVVPALSAGFDQARIARDADRYWYVQRERGRVCIGCVELGNWALVHSQGLVKGDAHELGGIFQQLAMTSAGWVPDLPIYTQGFDGATLSALARQGWKVRQAGPVKVAAAAPAKGDGVGTRAAGTAGRPVAAPVSNGPAPSPPVDRATRTLSGRDAVVPPQVLPAHGQSASVSPRSAESRS